MAQNTILERFNDASRHFIVVQVVIEQVYLWVSRTFWDKGQKEGIS